MRTALITGASRGLGRALARALSERGWRLVIDARGVTDLESVANELRDRSDVAAVAGDVGDESHRRALIDAVGGGRLDLLVNNASLLGPSPQPKLVDYDVDTLKRVYDVNVFGPLRLTQLALPLLRASAGHIVNVTSDAAVEGYEGWGGYGSSKAAFEQWSRVLAGEEPSVRVWWVDPGDMNTRMHQEAFPGEDISDRQPPEAVVPALLELIDRDPPSGRYQAAELLPERVPA
jgi:NAD(P)-dependent dehydrogenase (short-subunit alcohol dehydrogenase family)